MPEPAALRPRLLVLASTYPRWAGDPEPGFVHELSRRLSTDFAVTVLAPHARGAARRERLDGVDVRRYRYAPDALETLVNDGGIAANLRRARWKLLLVPGFLLMQLLWLCALQLRYRYHLVHAHWLIPQGVLAGLLRRLGGPPFIVSAHGADVFALRGPRMAQLRRWVGAQAHAVAVVSRALMQQLQQEGLNPQRITVCPMGVDLGARFAADAAATRDADQLLFVGRLVPKKGLDHLLAALPAILAARPQTRLCIIGSGPQRAALDRQVQQLGLAAAVEFLGAVTQAELPAQYRAAALFVAPFVEASDGDQEGLGLVVLEALGCGCPVLLGDLPATREFPDAPGLCRVNAQDSAALARAVLAMLGDAQLHHASAVAARRALAQRWDWSASTAAYADLLHAACRRR